MPLKLGTIDLKMPYSKAYLGSTLIYQEATGEEVAFTSCLFPTEWTSITTGTDYKATNDYGSWKITASDRYGGSYTVNNAFDGSISSSWRNVSGSSTVGEVIIDCPVLIKPTTIHIKYGNFSSTSVLQGYNLTTGNWEDLLSFEYSADDITETITPSNYYSKFRIYGTNYSNSNVMAVYEFQITEGYYKPREDTMFFACPFPTSWSAIVPGTEHKATNDFGSWKITANHFYNMSSYINKAFDNSDSTYWKNTSGYSLEGEIIIDCPVRINPTKVYIKFINFYYNGGGVLQGYNSTTESWEDLLSISEPDDGFAHAITENITTSSYYNKFRIYSTNHSKLNKQMTIYEFQILEGYYK